MENGDVCINIHLDGFFPEFRMHELSHIEMIHGTTI